MAKGQNFEREICKDLSLWWSNGVKDDVFWRTAGSGARATQRAKQGKTTHLSYADITSNYSHGKILLDQFAISLKRGYTGKKNTKNLRSFSLLDMIDKPDNLKTKPLLIEWWKELERDIENSKSPTKKGLIICRRDRRLSLIIMPRSIFKDIDTKKPCITPIYNSGCYLQAFGLNLQIMKLKDFFYWCEPELLGAKRFIRRFGEKLSDKWVKPGPYPSIAKEYFLEMKRAVNFI